MWEIWGRKWEVEKVKTTKKARIEREQQFVKNSMITQAIRVASPQADQVKNTSDEKRKERSWRKREMKEWK